MASQTGSELPKAVTFDVYGTLVRFHEEVEAAMARVVAAAGLPVDAPALKQAWRATQSALQQGPYLPYRTILAHGLGHVFEERGWDWRAEYGDWLVEAVASAGPFPEVPAALEAVRAGGSRLVFVSNSDRDLIRRNVDLIGVEPDALVTAEDARAYKPSETVFRFAWSVARVDPADTVHVAAGFEHDIEPAARLGVRRIWINRRGETGDRRYGPYLEMPDLNGLPAAIAKAGET